MSRTTRPALEYVPNACESALTRRLLGLFVESHGRLLVGPISADQRGATHAAFRATGSVPEEVSPVDRDGKTRFVIWTTAA